MSHFIVDIQCLTLNKRRKQASQLHLHATRTGNGNDRVAITSFQSKFHYVLTWVLWKGDFQQGNTEGLWNQCSFNLDSIFSCYHFGFEFHLIFFFFFFGFCCSCNVKLNACGALCFDFTLNENIAFQFVIIAFLHLKWMYINFTKPWNV